MATLKQYKQVMVASKQKGYKKIEQHPKQGGKLGAEPTMYSRSAQKKKIKPKKGSYPLNFPEQIGYQY